jgi:hypothetical protein
MFIIINKLWTYTSKEEKKGKLKTYAGSVLEITLFNNMIWIQLVGFRDEIAVMKEIRCQVRQN